MKPVSSARPLRHLAALLSVLLAGFVLLFSWFSWQSERDEQIRQMRTALALSETALDRYFLQIESGLRGLALDLQAGDGHLDLPRAQRLIRRFGDLHAEAVGISLLAPDGQVLLASVNRQRGALPTLAGEPSFEAFKTTVAQSTRLELGRPLLDPLTLQWVFPLRYVLREESGELQALLSLALPVELLEAFWREAPLFQRSSIGLLRDDAYMLSRYPVPSSGTPRDIFGQVRSGALARALHNQGYPEQGYVEGPNQLTGQDHGNAYQRLEHYPVTLFVSMPVSHFHAAWWQRVRVPYLLIALLAGCAALGYRYTLRNAQAWTRERRRTEAHLRASEEEQRFLVDHLLAGVVLHGPDGAVLRANAHALELFGLTQDQMMGRGLIDPAWRFIHEDGSVMLPAEYPVARVLHTRAAQRGLVLGVVRQERANPVWLLGDAWPDFDEQAQLRRVIVTFVDISQRRNAEQTLASSESRYRMMVDNVQDGLLQTRPDGTILSANPAACRIFGGSEEELRGLGRSALVDTADPRLHDMLAQRQRDGWARGSLTMRRRDGSTFEGEVSSMLYADESGAQLTSLVVRDVTDRRRAEAALAAQQLAERANRAKSEFMARMSHELRTPLNAILGFSEVLDLDTAHPLLPAQRQRLQLIRQGGDHLLALIDELLDLSRIESGTMHLQLSDVDVHELMRQVAEEAQAQAQDRAVELALLLPPGPGPELRADRRRLRQVLLNLVSNGIKYNAAGGRVEIAVATTGGRLRVNVRDNGLGMNEDQMARLFEPFNRLGREDSGVQGTGMGLVITRGLVELMGGHIQVSSQPGQGTDFCVELPLAPAADGPAAAWATQHPGAAAGASAADMPSVVGHVLYIDDDHVNRVLMQAFLGLRPGVRLSLAGDGQAGLTLARRTAPDLVLVDLMMPGMNGQQVLQALRAEPALRHTPCMAVSANAMPHEIQEALALGFDGYLTKPLSTPMLLAEVDRALRGR